MVRYESSLWGRGVAWLTYLPVKQEIAGSNPVAPAAHQKGAAAAALFASWAVGWRFQTGLLDLVCASFWGAGQDHQCRRRVIRRMDRAGQTEDRWSAASDQSCPENLTSCAASANLGSTPPDGNGSTMRKAHGNKRRIRATHVFGLTAIMVLILACVARVEAAVDLLYFRATGFDNYVLVEWATAQELDNVGFNLYRTEAPNFNDPSKVDLGFIPAQHPGEIWGAEYSYTDSDVQAGTTYYWLDDVDFHGVSTRQAPVSATPGPSATATPTSALSETPTSTPTATPTSTPTNLPTATATSTPTVVPSATTTSTPTSLPSGTPTSTPATRPTASSTPVAILTPSP